MRLLPSPSERCHTPPLLAASRVLASIARRRFPTFRDAVVSLPSHGFKVVADLGTPNGLRLYRYGLCDADVELTKRLLGPGDVFVDGGAHVGTFSLAAAVAVGADGRVIACEPDPLTVQRLRRNVRLNGFGWVDVHEVALTDHAGVVPFRSMGTASGLSSLAPHGDAVGIHVEVATRTLDEVIGSHHGRVRLVKLDVEGAELQALRGASRLLSGDKPDLILEVEPAHLARQGDSLQELEELLTDVGYVAYRIDARSGGLALTPSGRPWKRPAGGPNLFVSTRDIVAA